jgi:hypothetical protein
LLSDVYCDEANRTENKNVRSALHTHTTESTSLMRDRERVKRERDARGGGKFVLPSGPSVFLRRHVRLGVKGVHFF